MTGTSPDVGWEERVFDVLVNNEDGNILTFASVAMWWEDYKESTVQAF